MNKQTSDWTPEQIAQFNKEADVSSTHEIREMAKAFGFNCLFADDDLRIIGSLANRAIEAGLTDHLDKSFQGVLKKIPKPKDK